MYTQCPDCDTAFRVTAEVLKQAAGQVRCGGCGNAFNALEYLSEQRPERRAVASEPRIPELTPDIPESGLPQTISAEQSAALLKTLDELAGSDIRIEDTGVEWRVLDDDEAAKPAADDDDANISDIEAEAFAEPDNNDIDELLEDSPTPVDEFLTRTPEIVESPEIFEEPGKTPVEELRFDDNTPLPDDFGWDDDASQAAAPNPEPEPEPVREPEPQPDITLSEPEEWTDILDEFEVLAEEVAAPVETTTEPGDADEMPPDTDIQFALQAEALGIETGQHAILDDVPEEPDEEDEVELEVADEVDSPDPEEIAAELEQALEDLEEEEPELEELDEPNEPEEEIESIEDFEGPQLELIDEPVIEQHGIEAELAGDDEDSSVEHVVPPMTEEEMTVNMQIDEELLAIAVEDEDGFASTIVIPEEKAEDKALADGDDDDDQDAADEDDEFQEQPGFETIIMEGERIQSALDRKKMADDAKAAARMVEEAKAAEAAAARKAERPNFGMIAGVAGLVILLALQVLHFSREALATNPAFNDAVGPIYRKLGAPLQPAWDITGWRFEVSKGTMESGAEDNTEEANEWLSIYSRVGNKSEQALPYPLIAVSLTDRFEETLGSRVLEPADYLTNDLDPRKLVEPGNSFEASIIVKSLPPETDGFKLNVCYRLAGDQLKCAIDDFK